MTKIEGFFGTTEVVGFRRTVGVGQHRRRRAFREYASAPKSPRATSKREMAQGSFDSVLANPANTSLRGCD
jgi:hypothetical protein